MGKLRKETIFILSFIILLWMVFGFYVSYLLWGEWSYDQGFYFVVARLMDQGHIPYSDIHMSEQPLMAWSAYLAFRLFDSVWGMQFFSLVMGLLGVSALVGIGRSLNGRLTGFLAGLFFVAHFVFFLSARTVNPETTSLSFGLVAIAFSLRYCTSGKRVWLLFSAIAMAISFLLKLFMVVIVPLIILLIIFYPTNNRTPSWKVLRGNIKRTGVDCLLWFSATIIILVVVWISVGFSQWWEQSVVFYTSRNAAHTRDLAFNFSKIWELLFGWPILLILTMWGLIRSIVQFKTFGWVMLAWSIFTLLFLMNFTPLRSKHLIMLVPLVALLAAIGMNHFFFLWRIQNNAVLKWSGAIVILLVFLLLIVEMAVPFNALTKPFSPLVKEEHQPIVEMLKKFTSPADCLITDDPYISFVADRMPPPWFSNMSYARFRSGSLTHQDLIDITQEYNCQVFVPTFSRIKNTNREFYDLAKSHYFRVWLVDGAEIMLGKPLENVNPALPTNINFSNQVELLGIDWVQLNDIDNNYLYTSFYWQKLDEPFVENYKIFVQLRDQTGQTIANADHEMFDGLVPTQSWQREGIIKDTIRMTLAKEITPGNYTLYVGLYSPSTLERLPIVDDQSGENAAVFPRIEIE